MIPSAARASRFVRPVLTPWASGPATAVTSSVVVSVTDFASHRRRDLAIHGGHRFGFLPGLFLHEIHRHTPEPAFHQGNP